MMAEEKSDENASVKTLRRLTAAPFRASLVERDNIRQILIFLQSSIHLTKEGLFIFLLLPPQIHRHTHAYTHTQPYIYINILIRSKKRLICIKHSLLEDCREGSAYSGLSGLI